MNVKIVKTVKEVKDFVNQAEKEGKSVGFVPTMGYLHNGHRSLIHRARKENDVVVVSIFVNPKQFGPNEDLASYPRDLNRDAALCDEEGVDLIFNPEPEEMYGEHFYSYAGVNVLSEKLCGKTRPIHFQGVCTVVLKLFNIVKPDRAYFGQKDAQQLAIIKRMVLDLNLDIDIKGCPIVREEDGLAMSSRNTYLNEKERKAALILSQSLQLAKIKAAGGDRDLAEILREMRTLIEMEPLAKIDYLEAVDITTVQPVTELTDNTMIAMAVYIGKTRLIDNCMVLEEAAACR